VVNFATASQHHGSTGSSRSTIDPYPEQTLTDFAVLEESEQVLRHAPHLDLLGAFGYAVTAVMAVDALEGVWYIAKLRFTPS
jgi:hypothetical protein